MDVASEAASTVRLAGDVLTIELAENRTTGYEWTIAALDEAALDPLDDEFAPPSSQAPGAGGTRTLRFTVRAAGTVELALRRPWTPEEVRDRLVVRVS